MREDLGTVTVGGRQPPPVERDAAGRFMEAKETEGLGPHARGEELRCSGRNVFP